MCYSPPFSLVPAPSEVRPEPVLLRLDAFGGIEEFTRPVPPPGTSIRDIPGGRPGEDFPFCDQGDGMLIEQRGGQHSERLDDRTALEPRIAFHLGERQHCTLPPPGEERCFHHRFQLLVVFEIIRINIQSIC